MRRDGLVTLCVLEDAQVQTYCGVYVESAIDMSERLETSTNSILGTSISSLHIAPAAKVGEH